MPSADVLAAMDNSMRSLFQQRWQAHPVVRRDHERFNASCQDSLQPVSSQARVLVVDGRCVCINNGIGNLFGDYLIWFLTAALTGRRLFFDWKDTGGGNGTVGLQEADCLSSESGAICYRVRARFDLAEWFATAQGDSWRWTPKARAQLAAWHGSPPREHLFVAGTPPVLRAGERGDPTTEATVAGRTGARTNFSCVELVHALQGAAPLVRVRFSEGGGTGVRTSTQLDATTSCPCLPVALALGATPGSRRSRRAPRAADPRAMHAHPRRDAREPAHALPGRRLAGGADGSRATPRAAGGRRGGAARARGGRAARALPAATPAAAVRRLPPRAPPLSQPPSATRHLTPPPRAPSLRRTPPHPATCPARSSAGTRCRSAPRAC
jgi:hypothetical protein